MKNLLTIILMCLAIPATTVRSEDGKLPDLGESTFMGPFYWLYMVTNSSADNANSTWISPSNFLENLKGYDNWTAGSGDVTASGTPVDGYLGVWTSATGLEGDAALVFNTADDILTSSNYYASGWASASVLTNRDALVVEGVSIFNGTVTLAADSAISQPWVMATNTGVINFAQGRYQITNITGNIDFTVTGLSSNSATAIVSANGAGYTVGFMGQTFYTSPVGATEFAVYLSNGATNVIADVPGIIEQVSAATVFVDGSSSGRHTITNRLAANCWLVLTNQVPDQEIRVRAVGAASGGSSYTMTVTNATSALFGNLDAFGGTGLTNNLVLTITNGNAVEISAEMVRLNGTNVIGLVSRQYKF